MTYLIDACVLIEAKNRHYGLDFVPAFWDWIRTAHQRELVYTVDRVLREVLLGRDELSDWIGRMPPTFSLKETSADTEHIKDSGRLVGPRSVLPCRSS